MGWTAFLGSIGVSSLALWLGKTWIAERLKRSIKFEYNEKLEILKAESQAELQMFKAVIDKKSEENKARIDYEYEARKRLYESYEPVRFQLIESCESAIRFIDTLGLNPSQVGKVDDGSLPRGNYRQLAFIYNMLLPLAHFRLVRRMITFVDLSLSFDIHQQYSLMKIAYKVITEDATIADLANFRYTPYVNNWRELRVGNPRYRRQGFAPRRLENTLDKLITFENNSYRAKTFGEFEEVFGEGREAGDYSSPVGAAIDLFDDFSPGGRPVLWRILVVQYILYTLLIKFNKTESSSFDHHIVINDAIETIEKIHREVLDGVVDTAKAYLDLNLNM